MTTYTEKVYLEPQVRRDWPSTWPGFDRCSYLKEGINGISAMEPENQLRNAHCAHLCIGFLRATRWPTC